MLFQVLLVLLCTIADTDSRKTVLELGDDDLMPTLQQYEMSLVVFHAPWCPACNRVKPMFERAADIMSHDNPPIALITVDCTAAGKKTCEDYAIHTYPTIKMFYGDKVSHEDYRGPRNVDGIVKYMRAQFVPASSVIYTVEELDSFLDTAKNTTILGCFQDINTNLSKLFFKFARENRLAYRFGHSSNVEVLAKRGETDAILLIRPTHLNNNYELSTVKFVAATTDIAALLAFVKANYHGLVGHRTYENARDFEYPLIVVYYDVDFVNNAKTTHYWRNRVLMVAKEFVGKLNFAISSKYGMFGFVSDTIEPTVIARDAEHNKYVLKDTFSVENLRRFAKNFLDGKLEISNELAYSFSNARVQTANIENFDEVVLNNGKDTLLEFYVSKCEKCKVLQPIYEKLAVIMRDENVAIVKVEAAPTKSLAFPAFFWMPLHDKPNAIPYSGGLELHDFVKFIAAKATNELQGFDRSGNSKKIEL